MYDGSVLFTSSGAYTKYGETLDSTCTSLQSKTWAIHPTGDQGQDLKTQISGLLMAYAAGKGVVVEGTQSCKEANKSRETVLYFYIP